MSGFQIVSLLSITASLFLAVRGLKSHGLSFEYKSWMAVAWLIIIGVVAFLADRFGA